jgi:hypothetical protein
LKSELQIKLEQRLGEHRISKVPNKEEEFPLLRIELELSSPVTILMTDGLSNYKMPVPDKYLGREFNELYFCLPSYWDWDNSENPNSMWIYTWIRKMAKYVIENETWFGVGHSVPSGKELLPFSPIMKQNHFFLSDPILLEQELEPIVFVDRTVYFLAIIPIFKDEMDYKQARGAFKFLQKLNTANVTEKLDDYRSTVLKSKWRFGK